MNQLIRFCFPLNPRLQSFITLRDGLQCLERARQHGDAYSWLQAIQDIRVSLLGEQARKVAAPEILGLLKSIRIHLHGIAQEHPNFQPQISAACDSIKENKATLQTCIPPILDFLAQDGLINTWANACQKQDYLAHKLYFPQVLPVFWEALGIQHTLHHHLQDFYAIITHMDAMLNDFVPWVEKTAHEGRDQIMPPRDKEYGLLIVGIERRFVNQGIFPEFSGNKLAIRLRFQRFEMGEEQQEYHEDIPYHMMMVPIA